MTMDEFTRQRICRLVDNHKKSYGRDISEAELTSEGVEGAHVAHLVHRGVLEKYQVTTGKGAKENRFKLHRDWRTLREP